LHKLGEALELFEEQKIYLVTQAANDLNLTFVLDEEQGDRLVTRLHQITIHDQPNGHVFRPNLGTAIWTEGTRSGNPAGMVERKRTGVNQAGNRAWLGLRL